MPSPFSLSSYHPLPRTAASLIFITLIGCGYGEKTTLADAAPAEYLAIAPKANATEYWRAPGETNSYGLATTSLAASAEEKPPSLADGAGASSAQEIPERKIIQNHNLEIAVEDLDVAEKRLRELAKGSGGYISRSELNSNPGARRQGSWTLRVPGTKASDIASRIVALGEPIRQSSDARDVSEEFYDLQARIKNKKVEEDRLIQHLKDSTGKLVDILAVEKEITRVRGEIEQSQGRLNMLGNLTSLATIQVGLVEHKNYKPEPAPTFGAKAARTFDQSLEGLYQSFANLTLWIIAWSPWLAFWAMILGFTWMVWIIRKSMKKP